MSFLCLAGPQSRDISNQLFYCYAKIYCMAKEFKKWHSEKEDLHEHKQRPFFHEREVWFASLGVNIGFEQDGRGDKFLRPVIVTRKFNNEVLWILPLTKNIKKGKYYIQISISDNNELSTVILSQIRLLDSKRLQYKIGDISVDGLKEIKKRLAALI